MSECCVDLPFAPLVFAPTLRVLLDARRVLITAVGAWNLALRPMPYFFFFLRLSTLRFADRAKQIENLARVNVDPAHVKLLELMAENDLLRSANKELSAKLARDTARESKAAKSRMCTVS